jgi:hypothetical protein
MFLSALRLALHAHLNKSWRPEAARGLSKTSRRVLIKAALGQIILSATIPSVHRLRETPEKC